MKRAMAVTAALLVAGAGPVITGPAAQASITPGWSQVFQSGNTGFFASIDPISQSNIWAAATLFSGNNTVYKPYVVRYNGSTWNQVTIPGAAISSTTVQSTSASDVWVFGLTYNKQDVAADAAYQWNGSSWRRIPVPSETYLQGTVVLGPSNVWAFGGSGSMAGDIFHWNGSSWKAYDTTYSFNFFPQSISASSASNVWIGGIRYTSSGTPEGVAYRWNGSGWSQASTPHPNVEYGGPSVTVLSSSDVWIGWPTETASVAAHWNGHTWTSITSPDDVESDGSEIVPDGRGGMWWGPFADWTGSAWINTVSVSPSDSAGGFGPVASIPGTSSAVMAAGVENTGSSVEHPTIYRLTFGYAGPTVGIKRPQGGALGVVFP
jgi:hypothetical protein